MSMETSLSDLPSFEASCLSELMETLSRKGLKPVILKKTGESRFEVCYESELNDYGIRNDWIIQRARECLDEFYGHGGISDDASYCQLILSSRGYSSDKVKHKKLDDYGSILASFERAGQGTVTEGELLSKGSNPYLLTPSETRKVAYMKESFMRLVHCMFDKLPSSSQHQQEHRAIIKKFFHEVGPAIESIDNLFHGMVAGGNLSGDTEFRELVSPHLETIKDQLKQFVEQQADTPAGATLQEEIKEGLLTKFNNMFSNLQSHTYSADLSELSGAPVTSSAVHILTSEGNPVLAAPGPDVKSSKKGTFLNVLSYPFQQVRWVLSSAGERVDSQIGAAVITIFGVNNSGLLRTSANSGAISWLNHVKTAIYGMSCALIISSWMLKPARQREELSNVMAGAAIISAALGIFCNIFSPLPLPYAVTAIVSCMFLVLLAAFDGSRASRRRNYN